MRTRMLRTIESSEFYTEDYQKKHKFELGEMYIDSDCVVFTIGKEYRDLFNNGKERSFKYYDYIMEGEISKYLPKIIKSFEEDQNLVLVIQRNEDLILLKDVLDYFDGKMDPKHVAWIVSSMYNIACYLGWAEIAHNDISVDTYFISPEFHSGALLGGWWYAVNFGEKMLGTPNRTYNLLPQEVKDKKGGDRRVDLNLIKKTGLELLGGADKVPLPLVDWFTTSATGDALSEYSKWKNEVLIAAFDERRFTKMDLSSVDVYTKEKKGE